jgi:carbonic anhydrase
MRSVPTLRVLALGLLVVLMFAGCGDDDDDDTGDTGTETTAATPPPFAYKGKRGPTFWSKLDPGYVECNRGKSQSPVDLADGKPSMQSLEVSYAPGKTEMLHNGHTVEAEVPEGSTITLDGVEYELLQFHYHAPGEHTIGGKRYPLEFHFVNEAEDGTKTVLGVMATEGTENPAFSAILASLPQQKDETAEVDDVEPADLLEADPDSDVRWFYQGSLTTPPCTEGVQWTVFNEPIELSADQIAGFAAVTDNNSRPLQPLNGRELLLIEPD